MLFPTAAQYRAWLGESPLHRLLDALRLTEIYASPLTMFLLGLFFLNLILVAVDRIPVVLRRAYLNGEVPRVDPGLVKESSSTISFMVAAPAGSLADRTGRFFRKRRWGVVTGRVAGTFVAVRNRLSPLGFFLFHGSFILCLLGGLVLTYTRFTGKVAVAEGETLQGRLDTVGAVVKSPLLFRKLPEMLLHVDRIETRYEEGAASDLIIDVDSVIGGVSRKERIRVNEPLTQGAVSLVAQTVGLAPVVVVTAPDGRVVDTAVVKLNVLKGHGDSFALGSRNQYHITVRYFPDYAVYNGAETSRSPEPRNPAFHLVIEKEGAQLYDGTVRLGEEAAMEGFRVAFKELHYCANFQIIREYGQWPLIAGFLLGSLGLIMRLIFYQKRVQLVVEEREGATMVYLLGQAEYFPHSFAGEIAALAADLQHELNGEK
ncbi:MAG TPA: cytochrome c biogenesis protein ResB [Geobacteraceae bacterium]